LNLLVVGKSFFSSCATFQITAKAIFGACISNQPFALCKSLELNLGALLALEKVLHHLTIAAA
jgi:hypothetical protein